MMNSCAYSQSLPTIVLRDPAPIIGESVLSELSELNGLGALLALLADSGEGARQGLRSLMRSLIDEGQRYAQTPGGRRWAALLKESPAITNGWLLWNQCNADFYLRNAKALADSPAAMLEAALQELKQIDLTELIRQLSRLSAQMDADYQAASDEP
jgi:hypothetical protein